MKNNKFENYYQEFSNETQENLEVKIEKLEQDIVNGKKAIANMSDVYTDKNGNEVENKNKKTIEQSVAKMEKEKSIITGYAKNKTAIDKIRNMQLLLLKKKQRFSTLLETYKTDKKSVDEQLKMANAEKKEAESKADGSITNEEYDKIERKVNELTEKSVSLEKQIKENEKQLESLSISTSKCDMAWKYLIQGKTWEDIKAKEANFKNKKLTATKGEVNKIKDLSVAEKTKQIFKSISGKNEEDKENKIMQESLKEQSLIPAKERKGIVAFFKNLSQKIKNIFHRDDFETKIESTEQTNVKKQKTTFIDELRNYTIGDESQKIDNGKEMHQKQINMEQDINNDNTKDER